MAEGSLRVGLRRSTLDGSRILTLSALVICAMGNLRGQAPSQDHRPLGRVELMARLAFPGPTDRLQKLIDERGIAFQPTETDISTLKSAGADDALIAAVQKSAAARASLPTQSLPGEPGATATSDQAAKEATVLQHLASAAGLMRKFKGDLAADEFRAAIMGGPDDALLHVDLAIALRMGKSPKEMDASIAELREALRLQPALPEAHFQLAWALRFREDVKGAVTECQEALRLEPHYDAARLQLGPLLEAARDFRGAISVYREGARLEPGNWVYHVMLGGALEKSGDRDGAIAEEREAARLKPDVSAPHFMLARMIRETGDVQSSVHEMELARDLQAKQKGLHRIRIGGQVMAAKLISKTQPEYPKKAKDKRVQGTVRLQAVIGPDGYVQEMNVISGDPLLVNAATEAVQHWVYEPTLLNGEPIEVVTEINISFNLRR